MSRGIDGDDARYIEAPFELRVCEGCDERAGSTVDVNGNVEPSAFLEIVHYDYFPSVVWKDNEGMRTRT